MCRLAAYLGPEILLGQFLLKPPHSLYRQAWQPKEMQEATLNADGFGFGWYSRHKQPVYYTDTMPIWSDANLTGLSVSLRSCLWLANVRSATPGQQVSRSNTQPFANGNLLFAHNGYIEHFNPQIRIRFHEILRADVQAGIQGHTDSEYIFALLRQQLTESADLLAGFRNLMLMLSNILHGTKALLNVIVSDGAVLYVMRHALAGSCPSLYYSVNESDFPEAVLIASEPLTNSESWQEVPAHSYTVISDNRTPEFIAL